MSTTFTKAAYQKAFRAIEDDSILIIKLPNFRFNYHVSGWGDVRFIHEMASTECQLTNLIEVGAGDRIAINSLHTEKYPGDNLCIFGTDDHVKVLSKLDLIISKFPGAVTFQSVYEYEMNINSTE